MKNDDYKRAIKMLYSLSVIFAYQKKLEAENEKLKKQIAKLKKKK